MGVPPMRRRWRHGLLAMVVVSTLGATRRTFGEDGATPPPVGSGAAKEVPADLAERVSAAISRGVEWLKARQDRHGSWGDLAQPDALTYNGEKGGYDEPAGPTALALYALLKCRVPVTDPVVKKGFAWLRKNHPKGGHAYEISALLLAVTATATPAGDGQKAEAGELRLGDRWREWARDLTKELLRRQGPRGWRYWGKGDTNAGGLQDVSSTQFALLALLAAQRCGVTVPAQPWSSALAWTRTQQDPEGPSHPRAVHVPGAANPAGPARAAVDRARGFAYIREHGPSEADRRATGAMTACGVATLLMARHALSTRHPKWWAEFNAAGIQQGIFDGLAWLDLHWSAFENPGRDRWHIYYLYCIERALDLAGVQRVGKHFWYAEMAEELVRRQEKGGAWNSKSATADSPVLDTSFALLFLERATRGGIPFPSVTGETAPQPGAK